MAEAPSRDADRALQRDVRRELRAHADANKAPGMQAYMKSEMPYYGVNSPQQKQIFRGIFDRHELSSATAWRATVLALWRGATHREERYAAIALTGHGPYSRYRTMRALPLYEEMIVTGAWWDYVDSIAVPRVGELVRTYPDRATTAMRKWARAHDMWKRRTSIICQVGSKTETDLGLLYECIEANTGERDFFIRKAIGWALRAYAWTDHEEVAAYVEAHRNELSPLSKREALKNVDKIRVGPP